MRSTSTGRGTAATSCAPREEADTDGDGVLTNEEGMGEYGMIFFPLTTKGSATPKDALAADRMPVADATGPGRYERTFPAEMVPDGLLEHLSSLHVVQHGIDVNNNGKYDMAALGESTFAKNQGKPGIPEEATNPAVCGVVQGAGAADPARGGPERAVPRPGSTRHCSRPERCPAAGCRRRGFGGAFAPPRAVAGDADIGPGPRSPSDWPASAAYCVLGSAASDVRPPGRHPQLGCRGCGHRTPPSSSSSRSAAARRPRRTSRLDLRDRITGPVLPESDPVTVSIPRIGARSGLVDLGLEADGAMAVPDDPARAGWFTGGPTPGALGPAVIAGHVTWDGAPGVFHRLGKLRRGDQVAVVTREDGRVAVFAVSRVARFSKSRFPTRSVYGAIDHAGLRLITCGGTYDAARHRYLDNVVVFAKLAAVRGPEANRPGPFIP